MAAVVVGVVGWGAADLEAAVLVAVGWGTADLEAAVVVAVGWAAVGRAAMDWVEVATATWEAVPWALKPRMRCWLRGCQPQALYISQTPGKERQKHVSAPVRMGRQVGWIAEPFA